jgi:hypothetical protein
MVEHALEAALLDMLEHRVFGQICDAQPRNSTQAVAHQNIIMAPLGATALMTLPNSAKVADQVSRRALVNAAIINGRWIRRK